LCECPHASVRPEGWRAPLTRPPHPPPPPPPPTHTVTVAAGGGGPAGDGAAVDDEGLAEGVRREVHQRRHRRLLHPQRRATGHPRRRTIVTREEIGGQNREEIFEQKGGGKKPRQKGHRIHSAFWANGCRVGAPGPPCPSSRSDQHVFGRSSGFGSGGRHAGWGSRGDKGRRRIRTSAGHPATDIPKKLLVSCLSTDPTPPLSPSPPPHTQRGEG